MKGDDSMKLDPKGTNDISKCKIAPQTGAMLGLYGDKTLQNWVWGTIWGAWAVSFK